MEQMRIAKVPTQLTIARVRALIAGEPLPEPKPSPRKGVPIARAHAEEAGGHRLNGDEIARRRSLADAAHAVRRPGETLQHAQARVRAGEDA